MEEAEIKRMKELKVKEELELLLERSRKRQAEEERLARLDRLRRGSFLTLYSKSKVILLI